MKKYESISRNRDYYERRLYAMYADLEHAKINNTEREKLVDERNRLMELRDEFDQYRFDVKRLISAIETEDRQFKNRRIDYLNTLITESLADIFPDDDLKAHLHCDFYRKNGVTLTLVDSDGNELIPDICSGKLQQYLISFAAVAGIASGLGVKSLYVDEAFGVAAPAILGELGKVIQKRAAQGMQIVMIAQNPGLYQDLPRREICLQRDPVSKNVIVANETDY